MKKLLARNIYPLFFGLFILTVFITHFFHPEQNPYGLGSDTYEYWHLSTNILKYKEFVYTDLSYYSPFNLPESIIKNYEHKKVPCTIRMPGYPFILAISRGIWDSVWVTVILVYGAYIGVCLYGFRLGALFLPKPTHQWVFNLLLALTPVYLTRWGVGSDLPASFFVTGFSYHIFRQFHSSGFSIRHTFWACLWAILANFTRANLLIFTFVLLIAVFVLGMIKDKKKICCSVFLIMLALGTGLGIWGLRNKKICDQWSLSLQGGAVLYAVHLSYDLSPDDPLYYWLEKGRVDFFNEKIRKGKTFNQIERSLNEKLKAIVWNHYKGIPVHLLKKWNDGLRTFFMFSYYDISDLIVYLQNPLSEWIHHEKSPQHFLTQEQLIIRKVLFQISRIYKIIIAVVFFLVPVLFFLRKEKEKDDSYFFLVALYTATFLGILATAFFTGAGGDRMRMPFNVFILIFVVWFFIATKSYIISILNKTGEN